MEGNHQITDLAVREPTRLDDLARLGTWLALSESGDGGEKAQGASAALRLYYAESLGLPPLAVAELSVIKGRLVVSAQLLRALAERRGYRVRRVDDNDQTCTAILERDGNELGRATFTIDDAHRAGLIRDRSAWKTHPARMLWARASKNVIVDYAPSVALGLWLDDEAVEILDPPEPPPDPRPDPEPEPEPEPAPPEPEQPTLGDARRKRMQALFRENGIDDRNERLSFARFVIGHDVASSTELTDQEADAVIFNLERYDRDKPETWPSPEDL